ncbi:hypothetical protein SELSPUOL_01618 [Selenomonas sputigena ATCC 35185]|uniref:Uncharacterized protein n=1 Tax=Selenomonas sputigena (strain ATCC 35185 / DSM 20758 / CCUG 44933 / VPI D19B-28) TaxID=546271 RepID=C9LVX3_SELS3|nr:hypothetical protein SELSPUOL_01618 [Selenomonas sputigena ATCC 35185]
MVFLRYASLQLRVASSAHMSALPGRRFAAPRLAQKSLRFFSTSDCRTVVAEKITFQVCREPNWLFLSLDTILSNRIKKLSIAFTNVVHNRCFIKIPLDGHLA